MAPFWQACLPGWLTKANVYFYQSWLTIFDYPKQKYDKNLLIFGSNFIFPHNHSCACKENCIALSQKPIHYHFYICTIMLTVEILAHVCVSKNVGYLSAQVLRIANQCPVVFGFQKISASVMELYLVGSEVPYIKCASLLCTEKQTKLWYTAAVCTCLNACVNAGEKDRQTGVYTVRLLVSIQW